MRELWQIFWAFARIGALRLAAAMPCCRLFSGNSSKTAGWTSDENLLNYFALGQSVPGVIAVNAATFIGHERRGVPGPLRQPSALFFLRS